MEIKNETVVTLNRSESILIGKILGELAACDYEKMGLTEDDNSLGGYLFDMLDGEFDL